jgi:hypothetical protein
MERKVKEWHGMEMQGKTWHAMPWNCKEIQDNE